MKSPKLPGVLTKSAHMRAVLVLFASVGLALLVVMASFVVKLQQANDLLLVSRASHESAINFVYDKDDDTTRTKYVFAPNLVELLGLNVDEALAKVGHGAATSKVETTRSSQGEVRMLVTAPLSESVADEREGTPTLYLTLDGDYTVLEAGFKAGMSYLGYGNLAFTDAIENAHVVENTLQEAGLFVEEGTVSAPEDKLSYSTYASDGVNLVMEQCEFSGKADGHEWRAKVTYDYSLANSISNLAYTTRYVEVYVQAKS